MAAARCERGGPLAIVPDAQAARDTVVWRDAYRPRAGGPLHDAEIEERDPATARGG